MFYLVDHIQALEGVIDVNPSKTVEINGNYRILVQKDQFSNLRRLMKKNLPQWYSEHVPTEAMPREGQYPGSPRVAPLMEDGYSSGEDSYMANSIATAFSFEGPLPPMEDDGMSYNPNRRYEARNAPVPQQDVPAAVRLNECDTWADRLRASAGSPLMQNRPFSPSVNSSQSDLLSDLASSRAEVAELKQQMSELTLSFEVQRTELIALFKEEMSRSLTEQLNGFMQQHPVPPQSPPDTTIEQVVELIRSQDLKFQALTDMVPSMMISSTTTSMGKWNPDDVYEQERAKSPMELSSDKRIDRKNSPNKQSRNKAIDGLSPSPSSPDHKEMDLSDDSSPTQRGNIVSSAASRGKDNTLSQKHD